MSDVLTIAAGVALGIILVAIAPLVIYLVLFGFVEGAGIIHAWRSGDTTVVYDVDPVDGTVECYYVPTDSVETEHSGGDSR